MNAIINHLNSNPLQQFNAEIIEKTYNVDINIYGNEESNTIVEFPYDYTTSFILPLEVVVNSWETKTWKDNTFANVTLQAVLNQDIFSKSNLYLTITGNGTAYNRELKAVANITVKYLKINNANARIYWKSGYVAGAYVTIRQNL
jgi:hypothetical protein